MKGAGFMTKSSATWRGRRGITVAASALLVALAGGSISASAAPFTLEPAETMTTSRVGVLTVTSGVGTADVAWQSASDSAAGWRVWRDGTDTHGEGEWSGVIDDPGLRTFQFTRLIPGRTYTFRVTRLDDGETWTGQGTQPGRAESAGTSAPTRPPASAAAAPSPAPTALMPTADMTAPRDHWAVRVRVPTSSPGFRPQPQQPSHGGVSPLSGEPLISSDIKAMPLGSVNKQVWTAEFPETASFEREEETLRDTSIVSDPRFGQAMRVTLPAGRWSGDGNGDHGLINFPKLDRNVTEATMDYYLRFDPNFDWSWGGKLPGLMGVAPGVNPIEPHKGSQTDQGWSARRMWLTNASYGSVKPSMANNMVTYFYWPGRNSRIAENVWWQDGPSRVELERGQWHHVRQHVRMNTPGQSDGVLREWVDGELVLERTNAEFRVDPSVEVTNISWNIFRGGNTADWRGSRDSWVDFADIKVVEGPPA